MSILLPAFYMITGKFKTPDEFREKLETALQQQNLIVQLRCKHITDPDEYLRLVKIAEPLCQRHQAILLLASSVEILNQSNADGLHLNSQVLNQYRSRPVATDKLLSVSCHTIDDMQQARQLGADILLLSPVKETSSHPGVPGIGWDQFSHMLSDIQIPVYALGGMQASDLDDARQAGAQGIAAISSFWK
ncbi:MAG: thiamine phosphate synthase [Gammaproteobacteria bacterium]|nr:thiamine phosphate synthase [Gammaproteobacteria bacterium]